MGSRRSNPSVKPGQMNPIDSNTIRSSSLRDYTPSNFWVLDDFPGLSRDHIGIAEKGLRNRPMCNYSVEVLGPGKCASEYLDKHAVQAVSIAAKQKRQIPNQEIAHGRGWTPG